ncbi:methyltransferase domain-containing protein [Actinoplanes sp. NPDC051494]|uniref:methyltransferase domain-containing protein n=1 Tax=Actinoplanes sp. NPDC051494 TaxID=3363907 RepID=UPI0037B761F2
MVTTAAGPPASLLELGCGVGRLTRPLTRLGYDVTAVDESAAMLGYVTGGRTVCSPIEDLDLGRTFDVVLLASFLVHAPDPAGVLATCHRHVSPGGVVVIQREGEGWHTDLPRERPLLDGVLRTVSSTETSAGVRSVRTEYVFPDATWTQTFLSRPLSRERFEDTLAGAGLRIARYLDGGGMWVAAVR